MESIKIIWDFRGEDSEQTAIHHAIHVKEFCEKNQISFTEISHENLTDFHTIAFVIVDKAQVIIIRDALKPHRAKRVG